MISIFGSGIGYFLLYDPESWKEEVWIGSFLIASLGLVWFIYKVIESPILKLMSEFGVKGHSQKNIELSAWSFDEYRVLHKRLSLQKEIMNEGVEIIKNIENDNLDFSIYKPESHVLRQSLHNMQQQMINIHQRDHERRWTNEGLSKFVDILRSGDGRIESLGRSIISHLVNYTKSNQAGLYIFDSTKENLRQIAFYAYDRDKYTRDLIPQGYGLLWQCLFEKKPIHLKNVPDEYVNVKSGLGGSRPKEVLLIPMMLEEESYGVIELASFNHYEKYQVEFLERLAENISSSIASAETNEKTMKLLEESEVKTRELQDQEQQMRQNMEEMQSTQEEMERIQEEILQKDYNIKALIDSSEDTFFAIDRNYKIIVVNKTLQDKYKDNGITLTEGVNIFDCIPVDQHPFWKDKYDRCLNGDTYTQNIDSKDGDGNPVILRGYYSAIFDNFGKVIGASVRSSNITDLVKSKETAKVMTERVQELEEEIKKLKKGGANTGESSVEDGSAAKFEELLEKARKHLSNLKNKKK